MLLAHLLDRHVRVQDTDPVAIWAKRSLWLVGRRFLVELVVLSDVSWYLDLWRFVAAGCGTGRFALALQTLGRDGLASIRNQL